MTMPYVHGYEPTEARRLQDQAATLVELLHSDTAYPEGKTVVEAGCGIGAQTVTLGRNSPKAPIRSVDKSEASLAAVELGRYASFADGERLWHDWGLHGDSNNVHGEGRTQQPDSRAAR